MSADTRDLGIILLGAALLLSSAGYLTQCSSTRRELSPQATPSSAATADAPRAEHEREPQSIHEAADEKQEEERAKIKAVGHALQTIGADPELRKTYGFAK